MLFVYFAHETTDAITFQKRFLRVVSLGRQLSSLLSFVKEKEREKEKRGDDDDAIVTNDNCKRTNEFVTISIRTLGAVNAFTFLHKFMQLIE